MSKSKTTDNFIVVGTLAISAWIVCGTISDFKYLRKLSVSRKRKLDDKVEFDRELCLAQSIIRLGVAIEDTELTRQELEKAYSNEIFWLDFVFDY